MPKHEQSKAVYICVWGQYQQREPQYLLAVHVPYMTRGGGGGDVGLGEGPGGEGGGGGGGEGGSGAAKECGEHLSSTVVFRLVVALMVQMGLQVGNNVWNKRGTCEV